MSKDDIEKLRDNQGLIFNRIDKLKDKTIDMIEDIGTLKEKISDNKIDDLLSDKDIQKEISKIASKSSRKTSIKWSAGLIGIATMILEMLREAL